MAESDDSFIQYAGHVLFPRNPGDLTNKGRCPACLHVLTSTVCQFCDLDLGHPAAIELADVSNQAAAMLDSRLGLIGRIRFETAEARKAQNRERAAAAEVRFASPVIAAPVDPVRGDAVPVIPAPIPLGPVPPGPVFAPPVAAPQPVFAPPPTYTPPPAFTAPPAYSAPPAPRTPVRSRLSIQVLVLIAGIALLSLAAMSFLVYAFVNYGIEWRSAIIAAITVATFTIASLLRRRGLTGTAEGIAVFAVVLVYLDAFAVRANNLFGAENAQPQVYWGVTLLASAVGFVLWHRLSGLRTPSIAGFSAVGVGAGLLAYGLGESLEAPTRVCLSLLAVAAAGLLHPLASRRAESPALPERLIPLSLSLLALAGAVIPAFFSQPTSFWGATVALVGVALLGFAHVALTVTGRAAALGAVRLFGRGFAVIAGLSAAAATSATLLHDPNAEFGMIVPLASAALVVLLLDVTWRRLAATPAVGALRTATLTAALVAAVLSVVPLSLAAGLVLRTAFEAVTILAWNLDVTESLAVVPPRTGAAVGALAIVTVLVIGFSLLARRLLARRLLVAIVVAGVIVCAVPLLAVVWAIAGGWLLVGALGVAALAVDRGRLPRSLRVTVAIGSLLAAGLGYLASWASLDSWLAGSTIAVLITVGARWAFTGVAARAGLLSVAVLLGYVGAVGLAQQFSESSGFIAGRTIATENIATFSGLLALALIVIAAGLPSRLLSGQDRRVLFWLALPVALIGSAAVWPATVHTGSLLLEPLTGLLIAAGLTLALLGWIVLRGELAAERVVAALSVAPAVFFATHALGELIESDLVLDLAATAAALVVIAGALLAALIRPHGAPRAALDAGAAFVGGLGVLSASVVAPDALWLALLVTGVATLLIAIDGEGLFASASPRRFLGWLALALVTAGLWWRLGEDDVSALEPYVLPLAGALLLIALLAWRVRHQSLAAPFIALGGLLVAILPLAVSGSNGPLERPLIVGAVSAVLLIGGSWIVTARPLRRYLDVAAAAGAAGVLAVALGRASTLTLATGTPDARLDAWLGAALGLLLLAAFGQTRVRADGNPGIRIGVGQALGSVGLASVVLFEAGNLDGGDLAQVRVLAVILSCALLNVLAMTLDRGPLRSVLGWVAVAGAAVIGVAALATFTLEPVELAATLVVVAFVTSATALVVTLIGRSPVDRVRREIGFASLAGLVLLLTALGPVDTAWVVLEIAAVTALLLAISRDGLFGAPGRRKHLGWAALALAVIGLWWRLAGSNVRDVEPYVLPLTAALLLIALFVWRAAQRGSTPSAAPVIALGGLLVAILPLGLNGASGPIERAVIVGAASAALLLVGSFVRGGPLLRPWLDVVALAGALGVLVVMIGRAWFISSEPGLPDAALDLWLGSGLLVLLAGAVGQSLGYDPERSHLRARLGEGVALLGLSTVFGFELTALDASTDSLPRALGVVLVFVLLHVIAVWIDSSPFTRLLAWVALGFGALIASLAVLVGAFDEVEYASVPIAIALLASGAIQLVRSLEARSWPHLGPGMLVLMVPSLLATFDDRPLWRAVGLAVVGITVIVVGLLRRLQAPFLVASLVTIVHVIATFSPLLRELYEENSWLVWIVVGTVGGTLLVVLAARFEKSLSTARTTLRKVAELR